MRFTRKSLVTAGVLGLAVAGAAVAQTPIRDVLSPEGITISGTVTDVFGNKFVLEDASGKVLVESGPEWHRRLNVQAGEKLSVTGRPDGGSFEAFAITRADGTRIEIRSAGAPPPWAGRRGPREERGPQHVAPQDEKPRAELIEILRRAGYRDIDDVDRERDHYEVEARNRFGEKVEVHIDFAGNIYKEKRD